MTDILNALVILANFVLVPGLAMEAGLALGALGVTLVYAVLRFSNFAHGETMAIGTMFVILVTWGLQAAGSVLARYRPRFLPCLSGSWPPSCCALSRTGWSTDITAARRRPESST